MRRRAFITVVGGTLAAGPLAVSAQAPERVARFGYVSFAPAARSQREDDAFRKGLRELGYVEGRNLRLEYRSEEGDESRVQK
jgi:putative ABC transport system substrate-binding protein